MSDRVTVQITDGVADVQLTRPDKMNALDHEMFVGLIEAGERVVLQGASAVRAAAATPSAFGHGHAH